jgi:hypothetical protein
MFKRTPTSPESPQPIPTVERITSVLGSGVIWHGDLDGSGGVRIEGAFEGKIALRGMLVVGETGPVRISAPIPSSSQGQCAATSPPRNLRSAPQDASGAMWSQPPSSPKKVPSCADRSAWKKASTLISVPHPNQPPPKKRMQRSRTKRIPKNKEYSPNKKIPKNFSSGFFVLIKLASTRFEYESSCPPSSADGYDKPPAHHQGQY